MWIDAVIVTAFVMQIVYAVANWFWTRDVIYTARAYAMMSVSVCLSVCDRNALARYS